MCLGSDCTRPSSSVTRSMAIGMPSRATGVNFSVRTTGVGEGKMTAAASICEFFDFADSGESVW